MTDQKAIAAGIDKVPNPAGAPQPTKRRPRVFVVDDALVVRNLVIECIEEVAGLEVAGYAGSEKSALSWLRSHSCDVLILDLELRQGTGLGLLKTLVSFEAERKPVTIVFSNHADENSRRIAMQLGAAFFFDKMTDAEKLRSVLQEIATSRTQGRALPLSPSGSPAATS
jgi:DNA-binding NarL/FixJ family response regulator